MTAKYTNMWALFIWDPVLKEKRLHGIYSDGQAANLDALAMSNAEQQPTVEVYTIYDEPRFTSLEPAVEESAGDFDTPIHIDGEIR